MSDVFSESTLLQVFEKSANSLIVRADPPRFTMVAVSDQFEKITSMSRSDLIGKGVFEVFTDNKANPSGALSAFNAFSDVIRTKQPIDLPIYKYDIPDPATGMLTPYYWSNTNVPVLDEWGEVAYILNTTTDITEQEQLKQERETAARTLEYQQQRVQQLFEQAPVAIGTLTGPEHVVDAANEKMLEIWGKTADEVMKKPIFDGLSEAKGQGLEELLDWVYTTGERFVANERLLNLPRNGRIDQIYCNFVYEPFRELDGRITGIIVLATDVTENVITRQKIEASEADLLQINQRLELALEAGQLGSYELDLATGLMECTPQCKNNYGQPLHKAFNFPDLIRVISPGDRGRVEQAVNEAIISHGIYNTEYQITWPDGSLQWVRAYGRATYDEADKPITMVGVTQRITEQKLAEFKLQESEERFRTVLETIPHITWTSEPDGKVDFYNQRWYDYTGLHFEETSGWQWQTAVHPDDVAMSVSVFKRALASGDMAVLENRYRRADGQYRWHLNRALPLHNELGKITAWVGTATDIHEQKQLEAELDHQVQQRTQQLNDINQDLRRSNDNLQQFAYVASHDLQEPLRKVQAFGDILKNQYADQLGEGTAHLERMQAAASRMSVLIKDLLTFARISTRQETAHAVSLNQIIASVLEDLEMTIQQTNAVINVETLPTVLGDASQLGQLFQNLLSNALKFRKEDVPPVVSITAKQIAAGVLAESVKPARKQKTYHQINVTDNGIGFDPKHVERIFEVFQRLHSKSQYDGTGIGLAIVQKVATNHGGAIVASSEPGKGTTFQLYLPV